MKYWSSGMEFHRFFRINGSKYAPKCSCLADSSSAHKTKSTNSSDTVLVNSSSTSGLESLMADGAYNGADRVSDQSNFKFTIASATSDGSTPVTDYSALPDGYWTGDVKVQFNATCTTPSA